MINHGIAASEGCIHVAVRMSEEVLREARFEKQPIANDDFRR
ncbi:MAG TPA: hypothetical protein VJA26_18080 [Gammaproteobacteria bacterium]|nr:hypothetical protein [Gammaproteobacteria bacterium]